MAWLLFILGGLGCPTPSGWNAECLGMYYLHCVLHGKVSPIWHAQCEEQW
jgi:hypothetical protein